MSTLETILLILLVIDALALAVLVLLQQGKGADVGAAFGSGSASTIFGSAGASSFFTRATVWLSVGFFVISFGLAYMAKERAASIDDLGLPGLEEPVTESVSGEAAPVPPSSVEAAEAAKSEGSGSEALTPESERVDSDIPEL
ncbi:MAG: preprotein translocase subunit SecG [Pseudomonadales bacterium]